MSEFMEHDQGDLVRSSVLEEGFYQVIEVVQNESGKTFKPKGILFIRPGEEVRVSHVCFLEVMQDGKMRYKVTAEEVADA